MIRTKLGIKVLGLCALAFAVMGIAASGASASSVLVLVGAETNEGVGDEVTLEKDVPGILHSKISGTEVLFECPTIAAVGVKIAAGAKTANGGRIKFSGCKTKLNGAASAPCEPSNEGKEPGVVLTKPGHALVVLHKLEVGEDTLVEILPDEGATFATIEMGKECSIGTKVPVIGKLFLKDCENAFLTFKLDHLVEEGPLSGLFVISESAEHKATLLGSAIALVVTLPDLTHRQFAIH